MKSFVFGGIITATLVLGFGFVIAGQWLPALFAAGLGTLWLVNVWLKWADLTWLWLAAFTGLAAWGIWLDVSAIVMFAGVVITLVSWDLARFSQRLEQTEFIANPASLHRAHFQRLALVAGAGLLLGSTALGVQVNLDFGWAVLVGLLMITSLSIAVALIRRI